jgi:hypothetical protein
MEEKVESYFETCENEGVFPDEAGLIYALGISRKMYDSYMRVELRRYKPFALCLEARGLRRESILVREIFASKNRTRDGQAVSGAAGRKRRPRRAVEGRRRGEGWARPTASSRAGGPDEWIGQGLFSTNGTGCCCFL